MIRKTKVAIAATSLSLVGAGVAIGVPVALTSSQSTTSTTGVKPVEAATSYPSTTAETPVSSVSPILQSEISSVPSTQAARVDQAAKILSAITSSSLSKTSFIKLTIGTAEAFDPAKLGITLTSPILGVQVQVTKLPVLDKQSVRYVISEGSYSVSLLVDFTRFGGDNEPLFNVLKTTSATGFTKDAFLSLTIKDQPFDAFDLKIGVPVSLDSANVLVTKEAGTATVGFKPVGPGAELKTTFTSFASEDASTRVAAARDAIESLTQTELSLYMLGQTYASGTVFKGTIIGTQTPAAVQAVSATFTKSYGKTYFTYSIEDQGVDKTTGVVWIKDFSPDNSREQALVEYLIKEFKSVSSTTFSAGDFAALVLPQGTPWNAATLGVSFASNMEMNAKNIPGTTAVNFAQPVSISSWQDFPFMPRVVISKAAGSNAVSVRFTLGSFDIEQYNFSTQLTLEFKTFGSATVQQKLEAVGAQLAAIKSSYKTAQAFKSEAVDNDFAIASAWLGTSAFDGSPIKSLIAPFATNGVKVRSTKLSGSNDVNYEMTYGGQTKSLTITFTEFLPDSNEVDLGKAVMALQAIKTTTVDKYGFVKMGITKRAFDQYKLGIAKPEQIEGYSAMIYKVADSPTVTYTLIKDGYEETFDVTFTSFGPDVGFSSLTPAARIQTIKQALADIKTTSVSEAKFKSIDFTSQSTSEISAQLGVSMPVQAFNNTKTTVFKKSGTNDLVFNIDADGKLSEATVTITRFDSSPNKVLASAEQAVAAITTTSFTKKAFLDLSFDNDWSFKAVELAQALGTTAVINVLDTVVSISKKAGSPTVTYTFYYAGYTVSKTVTFTGFNPANISDADQAVLSALNKISSTALSFVNFSLLEVPAGTPFDPLTVGFDLPEIARQRKITVYKMRDGAQRLGSFWMQLTVADIVGQPVVNLNFWNFSSSTALAPTVLASDHRLAAAQLATLNATTIIESSFAKIAFDNVPFDSAKLFLESRYVVPTGLKINMTKASGSSKVDYVISDSSNGKTTTSVTFINFPDEGTEGWFVQKSLSALYKTTLAARDFYNTVVTSDMPTLEAFGKLGLQLPAVVDLSRFKVAVSKPAKTMWIDMIITPIWKGAKQGAFAGLAWVALDKTSF